MGSIKWLTCFLFCFLFLFFGGGGGGVKTVFYVLVFSFFCRGGGVPLNTFDRVHNFEDVIFLDMFTTSGEGRGGWGGGQN